MFNEATQHCIPCFDVGTEDREIKDESVYGLGPDAEGNNLAPAQEEKKEKTEEDWENEKKIIRLSPAEQRLLDLEEDLTNAMIECEMGEQIWCMSNFECGNNEVCFEKSSNRYFEDHSEVCEDKKDGCYCAKPKADRKCQYSPRVKKNVNNLNRFLEGLKMIENPTDEQKKEVEDAIKEVEGIIKECEDGDRTWCRTHRDCKGEFACHDGDIKEFLEDEYSTCASGECFCKRVKLAEGEKKWKEGHERKACTIM